MEDRIAIIGLIIDSTDKNRLVQEILHSYNKIIVGRMGLPRVKDDINVISLVVKASQKEISALSGKLGSIEGVTAKAIYQKA